MSKNIFDFYIDRGGTFTDVFYRIEEDGEFVKEDVLKLLSDDPSNYDDAPREAIQRIVGDYDDYKIRTIRMGTTVSTNALLERKGARTAFLSSKGFKDLLEIAYQNRPDIFDLDIKKPKQLYERVVELDERSFVYEGKEDFIDLYTIGLELMKLKQEGIESLAIALMHSYKKPEHEQAVKQLAYELGFTEISLSSELVPMIKYVPRASTTVIDAYLAPIIKKYIENFKAGFADGLKDTELLFMKSDGGLCKAEDFRGYNSILSGPAGGLTALRSIYFRNTESVRGRLGGSSARHSSPKKCSLLDVNEHFEDENNAAIELTKRPLIGFDMGGTSTDVSRFDGDLDLSFDSEIEGLLLQSPQLDITTVAAGGGSRLFYENGLFRVGPESAGSHPGPVCYKKGGYLAVTDANLVLGKLKPELFPKVFGPDANEALDYAAAYKAFEDLKKEHDLDMTVEEIAEGFIRVANETMARPIREVSSAKGFDVKNHDLVCFGGAAGQHAVAIAKLLGIKKVIVHRYSGILSAFGISLADQKTRVQKAFGGMLLERVEIDEIFQELSYGFNAEVEKFLNLRYQGTDTKFLIKDGSDSKRVFEENYKREFGFNLNREIVCEDVIVELYQSRAKLLDEVEIKEGRVIEGPEIIMQDTATIVLEEGSRAFVNTKGDIEIEVDASLRPSGAQDDGPSLRDCDSSRGNLIANDPVSLAIFSNRFMSIAEQMGKTLERTSISTNIKERRDFSCAIFNAQGDLIANAPHQPVHLGSMGYAVKKQIELLYRSAMRLSRRSDAAPRNDENELSLRAPQGRGNLVAGNSILSNHPVMGGSHLPDLTVITPVFQYSSLSLRAKRGNLIAKDDEAPISFVANRAHHADVGGISPGSMPSFSTTLDEEGIAIKSFNLVEEGQFQEEKLRELFKESRLLDDNVSDLRAQVASNNQGIALINDLVSEYSQETVVNFMDYILENSERAVRNLLIRHCEERSDVAISSMSAHDYLDDGSKINLKISIDQKSGEAEFDFTGTAAELDSNLNTPIAVLSSAILYCLRAILNQDIPLNQGFLKPIKIIVPEKSLLNPSEDKAVVAGNVQTSQRIVDVIFKAFGTCAASQGCMNNVIFGRNASLTQSSRGGEAALSSRACAASVAISPELANEIASSQQAAPRNDGSFGYYETIGGGAGATKTSHGASGVHTHMTNTRITDPEILESRYPVILEEFSIRENSGGKGKFNGGDGLIRVFKFLDNLELSLLTERRVYAPYGLNGGGDGKPGENWLINKDGKEEKLASKVSLKVSSGDGLKILSPGGGGLGS